MLSSNGIWGDQCIEYCLSMIELLILDFGGVCTYSPSEAIALGLDPADLAAAVRPEAESVAQQAREAGIVIAILSNELSKEWGQFVPLLQAVDHVVCCSDNGIYKPDRRAFQRCLLLSGFTAERALVVDDHPDNVAVAASIGMRSVLFNAANKDPWGEVKAALND